MLGRQEFRRAFPGEIGDLTFPSRVAETYVQDLLANVDTSGVAGARLKIVVDAGRGTAGLLLPSLLGKLDVDAFLVNAGLDERSPTETPEQRTGRDRQPGRGRGVVEARRSASGSARWASGSPSSTRPATSSPTNARCWCSST